MNIKSTLLSSVFVLSLAFFSCSIRSQVTVAARGETVINTVKDKLSIEVKITTHEVQIGKPSDARPTFIDSNCTYSKYPCSIVNRITISVSDKELYVPRSIFSDLADLNSAEINSKSGKLILTLFCGDASESYIVKVIFDENRIIERTLSNATEPDRYFEKTVYRAPASDNL